MMLGRRADSATVAIEPDQRSYVGYALSARSRAQQPPGGGGKKALILPAVAVYLCLFLGPLALLMHQSLVAPRPAAGGITLENYGVLFSSAFLRSLGETLKLSVIATGLTTVVGYLMAYHLIRNCTRPVRNFWLGIIMAVLFLSLLIRLYALLLTFSGGGFGWIIEGLFNVSGNSRLVTEALVVMGLLNFTLPLIVLSMLGPIENINPKLYQAAQSLGATQWKAFVTIELKLAAPSLISSAVATFSLCISAFLIPMVLGRGFVDFVSNLIYVRFQEVFDPASGAAMAVIMLVMSLALILGVQRSLRRRL